MSGSTIGGVIGGIIGAYFGNAQAGWMIGSAIGGYVDPDVIKGPKITDAQGITVRDGEMRPIVYGTAVVGGNIMQCGPMAEHKHKERTGKGGPVQVTYTYTRTVAIRLAQGTVNNILRIWVDGKLVYDVRDPADWPEAASAIASMAAQSAQFASTFVFYTGSETQSPDPSLQALPVENGGGYGNVPSYRGTSYIVFPNLDVTDGQGRVPDIRCELSCCGTTTVTDNLGNWIHGNTGNSQSIFDIGADGLVVMTAGWNNNLRRSLDGGVTWSGVDYATSTGWSTTEAIISVWSQGGAWYIAKHDSIAVSNGTGGSFAVAITPVHEIESTGIFMVNGVPWAGVVGATNTSIFCPLSLGDTTVSLGGNYGSVTAIGDIGGRTVVACGNTIRDLSGNVLATYISGVTVTKFAYGNGIAIAVKSGGYLRSTDGGLTWIEHAIGTVNDVTFGLGKFYYVDTTSVYSSADGLTWALEDTFAPSNTLTTYITSDGWTVLATTQDGITTAMASAYNLPDLATGWSVGPDGTITGQYNTKVTACIADLADIVTDVCGMAGVTADQIDVTDITGVDVRGCLIGRQMAAADFIRALQPWGSFDAAEWGDYTDASTKIRFKRRGGPVLFELTDDDLLWSDDDQDTRAQAVEFPRKVNVIAPDVNADYNPTKETAERQTQDVRAVGEQTVEVPLSMNRDEKKQLADKMLRVAWTEAEGRWERELPEEFTVLTPSDPFTHGGKRWRAERVEIGDGSVKVEAVRDRISAYTSSLTGSVPVETTPPPVRLRGPTVFAAMNLPQLVTQQNTPGMVIGVTGLLDGWIGCDLQMSVDGGATFQSVAQITTESTMGDLTADCGTSGTISIRLLHNHTMDTVSDAQIAARQNAWAITTGGTSEVGQSQTVDETGASGTSINYDLTGSTRGELSTTAAAHYLGDRFVLLDGNTTFLPIDVKYAGQTLIFRPVSIGTAAENNRTYSVVYAPLFTSAPSINFYVDAAGVNYANADGTYYYKQG